MPMTPAEPPDGDTLADVASSLDALAERTALAGPWASGAMDLLARRGVLAAFVPADAGGTGADEWRQLEMLMAVAERCLTTALVLSQWAAAVRLIATASADVRDAWLPPLARGDTFTTVGLSQITTSRQHVGAPVLVATRDPAGWRLDGMCPWVTGALAADSIVTGAATPGGETSFFVVPTAAAGLAIAPPLDMLALSASLTSVVRLDAVRPAATIAATGSPRSGGLATTALAVGAARGSVRLLVTEAEARPPLRAVAEHLADEAAMLAGRLREAARHGLEIDARERLRGDANGLVTRAAQAALTAAKGAGFVRGHPAERRARESLFFLVWSCPPAVATSLLCELAHVG